jgi:hypothetical protein
VVVVGKPLPGQPHIVRITFEAKHWASKANFVVTTNQDIVSARDEWPAALGGMTLKLNGQFIEEARTYGIINEQPEIRPGYPMGLRAGVRSRR